MAQATGRPPAKPRVPSQEETSSWCVLTPEEVAAARAIEGQPWEPKKPIYLKVGQNRSVPPVRLPLSLDLGQGGADVRVGGGKIEQRDQEGLWFLSESKDPQLYVTVPENPISQIKRITLYAEPSKDTAEPVPIELFFLTALYSEGSSFCWVQLGPLQPGGKLSVATSDIMGWSNFGTPLTAIRIDPGDKPGTRALLKRLVLE